MADNSFARQITRQRKERKNPYYGIKRFKRYRYYNKPFLEYNAYCSYGMYRRWHVLNLKIAKRLPALPENASLNFTAFKIIIHL